MFKRFSQYLTRKINRIENKNFAESFYNDNKIHFKNKNYHTIIQNLENFRNYDKIEDLKKIRINNLLGLTYMYLLDFDSAINAFRKAYEIDPSHVKTLYHVGKFNSFMGYNDKALNYFNKALKSLISVDSKRSHIKHYKIFVKITLDIAHSFKALCEYEQAIEKYNDALNMLKKTDHIYLSNGKRYEIKLYLGHMYMQIADYDKAFENYCDILYQTENNEIILEAFESYIQAGIEKGLNSFKRKNYSDAEKFFLEIYYKDPSSEFYRKVYYKEVVNLDPDNDLIHARSCEVKFHLGNLYNELGKYDEALRYYLEAIDHKYDDENISDIKNQASKAYLNISTKLGIKVFEEKNYVIAKSYFIKALKIDQENYNLKNKIGICDLFMNNNRQALANFNHSIKYNKGDQSDAWTRRAYCLLKDEKFEYARGSTKIAISLNPNNDMANRLLNKINTQKVVYKWKDFVSKSKTNHESEQIINI